MYGLIGYPLGHSFSARYFGEKFSSEGIDNSYHLFPIPTIGELDQVIRAHRDLQGLNVTIPYKEQVIPLLDNISEDASEIKAVNVIKITNNSEGGKPVLSGYNTDWKGFSLSLSPLLEGREIRSALVLGTGGASKAVGYALRKLGITPHFVSRNGRAEIYSYEDLDEDLITRNLLIVNTTPLGMSPNDDTYPPIPYQFITSRHICYDLVYNPQTTEFMRRASDQGAVVKNGLEMLYRQAELSWEIWNAH